MSRIYFSADIETNGLIPGMNSMISLGCVAFDMDAGIPRGYFKENLTPLAHLEVDEDTMNWWKQFPEAYARSTENAIHPVDAMIVFEKWVKSFGIPQPVLAVWKPHFDSAFIRYYLYYAGIKDIFGRAGSGLDIKTLTAAALNKPFSETKIGEVPAEFKPVGFTTHSHDALEDALEQAWVMYYAERKLGIRI